MSEGRDPEVGQHRRPVVREEVGRLDVPVVRAVLGQRGEGLRHGGDRGDDV